MRMHSDIPTPYAVMCPVHGRIYLTREGYTHQMNDPNAFWRCPCGRKAEFDDVTYEAAQDVTSDDAQKMIPDLWVGRSRQTPHH